MGSKSAFPGEVIGDAVAPVPAACPTLYQAVCRYVDRRIDELSKGLSSGTVKTVNGVLPDSDGNVDVQEGLPEWSGGKYIAPLTSKSTDRDVRVCVEAVRKYLMQEED